MIKKTILLMLAIMNLSCGGSDNNVNTDPIIGKWIIYKAEYGQTIYDYEINGQCGKEALTISERLYLKETFYTNEDCSTFVSEEWGLVRFNNGVYDIYTLSGGGIERSMIMTNNEIKVQVNETIIKYYRKVE